MKKPSGEQQPVGPVSSSLSIRQAPQKAQTVNTTGAQNAGLRTRQKCDACEYHQYKRVIAHYGECVEKEKYEAIIKEKCRKCLSA